MYKNIYKKINANNDELFNILNDIVKFDISKEEDFIKLNEIRERYINFNQSDLRTFDEWNELGYKIKKNSKGTKLYKSNDKPSAYFDIKQVYPTEKAEKIYGYDNNVAYFTNMLLDNRKKDEITDTLNKYISEELLKYKTDSPFNTYLNNLYSLTCEYMVSHKFKFISEKNIDNYIKNQKQRILDCFNNVITDEKTFNAYIQDAISMSKSLIKNIENDAIIKNHIEKAKNEFFEDNTNVNVVNESEESKNLDEYKFDYNKINDDFINNYENLSKNVYNLSELDLKNTYINIYDKAPYSLRTIGIDENTKVRISLNAIKHIDKHFDLDIKNELIKQIPNILANPICILNGSSENTFVIVSEIKYNNDNIVVPLYYNTNNGNLEILNVSTIYEKWNIEYYIEKEFLKHNVLAYNKEKMESFRDPYLRLYLPKGDESSIYDNNITNSLDNVKPLNREYLVSWETDYLPIKPVCYLTESEYINYQNDYYDKFGYSDNYIDDNGVDKRRTYIEHKINDKIVEIQNYYKSIGKYKEVESVKNNDNSNEPAKQVATNKNKIQDFGEKIGGAKKDLWKEKGISISNLSEMNEKEQLKYVVKGNIWIKPNYQELVNNGLDREVVYFYKTIIDALPTSINHSNNATSEDIKNDNERFINFINDIKEKVLNCKTLNDCKNFIKIFEESYLYKKTKNSYIYNKKDEYDNINLNKVFKVINRWNWYPDYFIRRMSESNFCSKEKPENSSKNCNRKKKYKYQDIEIKREGGFDCLDHPATGEDYLNTFKFRGGEFGNWLNDKERQENLNFAYNSFKDLAVALNIDDKDVSLNGRLSIAFGSRGSGNAMAHYEPLLNVINLTKLKGAGCLAHEYGHFLDSNIISICNKNSITKSDAIYASEISYSGVYWRGNEEIYKSYRELRDTINKSSNFINEAHELDKKYSKTGHGYWNSNCEKFARAFSCYIKDKLSQMNISNTYLTGHCEEAGTKGEERQKINKCFDNLFDIIKQHNKEIFINTKSDFSNVYEKVIKENCSSLTKDTLLEDSIKNIANAIKETKETNEINELIKSKTKERE